MLLRLLIPVLLCSAALAQSDLPRRGYLGATLRYDAAKKGAEVHRVQPGSPAASAGLVAGDVVTVVGERTLSSSDDVDALDRIPANKPVVIRSSRNGTPSEHTVRIAELPKEHYDGLTVDYGYVQAPSGRVRTVTTRPANATAKLPALFLVGWLSCDSVEAPFGPFDGFSRLLNRVITQSGFLVQRMDKPGVGDSEGDCSRTDFTTELAAYRAAFRQFLQHPALDRDRVFLLGMSNGGGVAPLVAERAPVRGYVSASGWGRTWYEHMLEHERLRLQLSGKSPAEVTEVARNFAAFYTEYLLRKKTPGEVVAAHPELKSLWYDAPDGQYGRPAAFYQQLTDLNLAREWSTVRAPVLVIRGEHDFIMSRADASAITQAVNFSHNSATFIERPKMDHGFMLHETLADEFAGKPGTFDDGVAQLVLDFLRENSR